MFSHKQKTRGFSLIEVLVYLAVTLLVAGAGVLTYITLNTVIVRNATERAVNHSAQVVLERMGLEIKRSVAVNTVQSAFSTSSGALALVNGTTTTKFEVSSGALILSVNGIGQGPLTGSGVTVKDFIIDRYVGTSTEMVRVALTLSASSSAASTTRTYYTSGVLRGSYE